MYLLHNKKPKYVLQEVGYTSTLVNGNLLPATQQFLPYLSDSSIWQVVSTAGANRLDILDKYFPMYKYNNEFSEVKEGILSYLGKGSKDVKYKGYQGQEKQWDSSFHNFQISRPEGETFPIDSNAVSLFRDFLNYCNANNIKVIMFYPPAFIQSLDYISNKDEILNVYNSFSKTYNIPFYNYMYDSLDYSRNNFYNSLHLNKAASEVFSRELAERIKKDMQ
jgi:hypothetical protein